MMTSFSNVHSLYVPEFSYVYESNFDTDEYMKMTVEHKKIKLNKKELKLLKDFSVPGIIDIGLLSFDSSNFHIYLSECLEYATESKLDKVLYLSGADVLGEYFSLNSFENKKEFFMKNRRKIINSFLHYDNMFNVIENDFEYAAERMTGILVLVSLDVWYNIESYPAYGKKYIIEEIIRNFAISTGISRDSLFIVLGGENYHHMIRPITRLCYVDTNGLIVPSNNFTIEECEKFLRYFKKTAVFIILSDNDIKYNNITFQRFSDNIRSIYNYLCTNVNFVKFYCLPDMQHKNLEGEYFYNPLSGKLQNLPVNSSKSIQIFFS